MTRTHLHSRPGGTRGAIFALLRRRDLTVAEIARALGLTGNGVRLQLARLERDGIIEARGLEAGVTKSSRLYGLAPRGQRAASEAPERLLRELLDELARDASAPRARVLLVRIGRRLARATAPASGPSADRTRAIVRALRGLGGDPVVVRQDGVVCISQHHCPLAGVVSDHPEACAFAHALVAGIWGAPVAGRCRHGDRPRCRFDLQPRHRNSASPA
jgi:predicted ArsR family transcriptional regulator